MPADEIDLLSIERGIVTAPAGCGKTHLIAMALKRHTAARPVLVLTHTNAGVAALRGRLQAAQVPAASYRLSTIDGWAIRLVSLFPTRSGLDLNLLKLSNPGGDYPKIRVAASKLLKAGHINDPLEATYSRIIVDEYQDCSIRQHAIVYYAGAALPVCLLGDRMQAIFGFGSDNLADWDTHVCAHFPPVGELKTPWRWINAQSEVLGQWLLEVRRKLENGEPIDLRTAPEAVTWIQLDGNDSDHEKLLKAARTRGRNADASVLIIGDSMKANSRFRIASSVKGAVTVEAVDLRDFVTFARSLDLGSARALQTVAEFAQSLMSNVGADDLVRRVNSLLQGRARKDATAVEQCAMTFVGAPTHRNAADLLVEISKQGGVTTYRPAVHRACLRALQMSSTTEGLSFHDAAIKVREQNRALGRALPRRAIGSTLLLKGLEGEVSVVLNAGELDARNLYVAMTRGSRSLVLCSRSPILNPPKP